MPIFVFLTDFRDFSSIFFCVISTISSILLILYAPVPFGIANLGKVNTIKDVMGIIVVIAGIGGAVAGAVVKAPQRKLSKTGFFGRSKTSLIQPYEVKYPPDKKLK